MNLLLRPSTLSFLKILLNQWCLAHRNWKLHLVFASLSKSLMTRPQLLWIERAKVYLSYLLAKSHKRNVDTYFPVSPLSISSKPLTLADVIRPTLSNGGWRRYRIVERAIDAQSSMGGCQVPASCAQCSQPDAEKQAILRCDASRKYFPFFVLAFLLCIKKNHI